MREKSALSSHGYLRHLIEQIVRRYNLKKQNHEHIYKKRDLRIQLAGGEESNGGDGCEMVTTAQDTETAKVSAVREQAI
ncbi:hypothetical protein DY000_02029633 [Brassica cretica]|uniref:Uncharacterized protein n=1 Tax=Brassica cretica TaxID=69181 RepID=A0ABQ7DXX7_BRACR|nr:hypothetical protein DY000_02029633 [Brassica cretica]